MNIILTGFMGTGKSVVGRRLAHRTGMTFHDVDLAIEAQTGRRVKDIFSQDGEPAFRAMERAEIAKLQSVSKTIVATGGGALLDPENRAVLSRIGTVICLTARAATLLERLKADTDRPLLKGEGELIERIERLLTERQAIYDFCELQIPTDGLSVDAVVDAILKHVTPGASR